MRDPCTSTLHLGRERLQAVRPCACCQIVWGEMLPCPPCARVQLTKTVPVKLYDAAQAGTASEEEEAEQGQAAAAAHA